MKRPQMTGRMVAQRQVSGSKIELQLPQRVHPPEVAARFAAVGGHQPGVVVIDQLRIFVAEAQRGGRFGGHDVISLPHGFGQDARRCVRPDRRACSSAPQAIDGHARLLLVRVDVDGDAVVLQHGHQGFGQLRVEVVGVDVNEVEHLLAAAARGAGKPAAGRTAQETPRGHAAAASAPARCRAFFPTATRICRLRQGPVGQRSDSSAQSAQQVETRHGPFGHGQAVGRHIGRFALAHQAGDVNAGRTFQPAAVAMHAQVGDRLELGAGEHARDRACRSERRGSDWPSPAARPLRRARSERWGTCEAARSACGIRRSDCTRPPRRLPAPAPNPIAIRRDSAARGEAASAVGSAGAAAGVAAAAGRRRCGWQRRTQVAREQVGIVADDLAGIQNVLGIEDPLRIPGTRRTAGRPAGARTACGSVRRRVRR